MAEVRKIAVMGATGRQGRGVIDALSFTKGSIHYKVVPMTRSLKSKLAISFKRDFPHLNLVLWRQEDEQSLKECFEGCYGVFLNLGYISESEMSLQEWTRAEIELGKRCIEAAKASGVSHLIHPTFPSVFNASNGSINIRYFETSNQISKQIQTSTMPSTILCPGPFYTDFDDEQYSFWEGKTIVFSTPTAPTKRMGWADPGHDIGWFTRAALEAGPDWMKGMKIPVCGQSISYSNLATKLTAVTGVQACHRECTVKEFEARSKGDEEKQAETRALSQWLSMAPDDKTCYGTIDMERLSEVEQELGIKAMSWEMFLTRTTWRGPPKRA